MTRASSRPAAPALRARRLVLSDGFYTSGLSAKTVAVATILCGVLLVMCGCGERSEDEWKIVFPAARDGDWAIYVVDRMGGPPVRIAATKEPTFGQPPVPSPDGRKLILA